MQVPAGEIQLDHIQVVQQENGLVPSDTCNEEHYYDYKCLQDVSLDFLHLFLVFGHLLVPAPAVLTPMDVAGLSDGRDDACIAKDDDQDGKEQFDQE